MLKIIALTTTLIFSVSMPAYSQTQEIQDKIDAGTYGGEFHVELTEEEPSKGNPDARQPRERSPGKGHDKYNGQVENPGEHGRRKTGEKTAPAHGKDNGKGGKAQDDDAQVGTFSSEVPEDMLQGGDGDAKGKGKKKGADKK